MPRKAEGNPAGRIAGLNLPLWLFCTAVCIRLLYFLAARNAPTAGLFAADAEIYHNLAVNMAAGTWQEFSTSYFNTLYPYFLRFIYLIAGIKISAVIFVQLLLDAAIAVIVFDTAAALGLSRKTAALAGLFYAFYKMSFFYAGYLLDTTLVTFLATVLFRIIVGRINSPKKNYWFVSGILCGLILLLKSHFMLFFLYLCISHLSRNKSSGMKNALLQIMVFVCGALIVLAPVAVKNHVRSGAFSPFPVQGAMTFFYTGNNSAATGYFAPPEGLGGSPLMNEENFLMMAERETNREMTKDESARFWFNKSLKFIFSKPLEYGVLVLKKTYLFWSGVEIPSNVDFEFCKRYTKFLQLPFLSFAVLSPLALLGFLMSFFREKENQRLLRGMILCYLIMIILTFVTSRYRFPVMPFLMIAAAYGAEVLWRGVQKKADKAARLAVMLFIAFCIFLNTGLVYGRQTTQDPFSYNNLGNAYLRRGDYTGAVAAFKRALSMTGGVFSEAHHNLANAHARTGNTREAIRSYREAIEDNPFNTRSVMELSKLYRREGRLREEENLLKAAINYNAKDAELSFRYAEILLKHGRRDRAVETLKDVLQMKKDHLAAVNLLGYVYFSSGDYDAAIETYKRALRVKPDLPAVRFNLANVYYKQGAYQEAIDEFYKVIKIDPAYGPALYNLSLHYYNKNDYKKAVAFSQRAEKAGFALPDEYLAKIKPYRDK